MRIRQGRHNTRNLYVQMGEETRDADECLAAFIDPAEAAYVRMVMNGDLPPRNNLYSIDGYFLHMRVPVLGHEPEGRVPERQVGIVFDPIRGEHMVQVLNGKAPPLNQESLSA